MYYINLFLPLRKYIDISLQILATLGFRLLPIHQKIGERHGSHLALDSGGSANGEFIRRA